MRKVLLFLYPIVEYTNMFLFHKDSLYDDWHVPRPLPIMDEAIDRRYRKKGYEVIFALYSNRDIYGLTLYPEDRVIDVGIPFPIYDRKMIESKGESIPYPNLDNLCCQVGFANQVVVCGYHASDCVYKVAKKFQELGINCLMDMDLTDHFFALYRHSEYFQIESYHPNRWYAFENEQFSLPNEEEFYRDSIYGIDFTNKVYQKEKEK